MKEGIRLKTLLVGTISLICAIIFFGGFAKEFLGGIFDFGKLTGQFPEWLKTSGGLSAKGGFLFALTLVPSVMLALGFVAIFEHFGALAAASKWLSPILKPLIGIPGNCSISLIASTQSTDAGSSTTKSLYDEGKITYKELLIFAAFQFSAGAMLTNFLASFAPLLLLTDKNGMSVPVSVAMCLGVILLFKIFGANLMRLYVSKFVKEDEGVV
ncbi:nucleoside recognition protein [Pasteurella langaaensis DSM 22999]|uniref:Nucleoside recognition protein n=1 Tax=Alitibacter langaaensis DSM 22999 TaxID=1122935 RepID=A0A2U0T6G7_9PAST|nr:nucleoside recognition domain-containing protein [Pasteurella langaaensis]PVX39212.1 nucleoside recognition protein [Pasteurella langaaensis DSM 22999]